MRNDEREDGNRDERTSSGRRRGSLIKNYKAISWKENSDPISSALVCGFLREDKKEGGLNSGNYYKRRSTCLNRASVVLPFVNDTTVRSHPPQLFSTRVQSTIAVGTQLHRAELEESFSKRSYRIIRLEIVILSRKYNFEIQDSSRIFLRK